MLLSTSKRMEDALNRLRQMDTYFIGKATINPKIKLIKCEKCGHAQVFKGFFTEQSCKTCGQGLIIVTKEVL